MGKPLVEPGTSQEENVGGVASKEVVESEVQNSKIVAEVDRIVLSSSENGRFLKGIGT